MDRNIVKINNLHKKYFNFFFTIFFDLLIFFHIYIYMCVCVFLQPKKEKKKKEICVRQLHFCVYF